MIRNLILGSALTASLLVCAGRREFCGICCRHRTACWLASRLARRMASRLLGKPLLVGPSCCWLRLVWPRLRPLWLAAPPCDGQSLLVAPLP